MKRKSSTHQVKTMRKIPGNSNRAKAVKCNLGREGCIGGNLRHIHEETSSAQAKREHSMNIDCWCKDVCPDIDKSLNHMDKREQMLQLFPELVSELKDAIAELERLAKERGLTDHQMALYFGKARHVLYRCEGIQ